MLMVVGIANELTSCGIGVPIIFSYCSALFGT
jgi:hypothetical protein